MPPPPSDSRALPPPALSPRDSRAVDHAHSLLDGDPRPAQAILKRIVLRNPESPAAWRAYTLGLLDQYKQSRCRAALASWRALAPEDPLIPAVEAGLHHTFGEAAASTLTALGLKPLFDEGLKRAYSNPAAVSRMVEGEAGAGETET